MNDSIAERPEAIIASGGIPLDLAPLLSPYAQHRRLSLAVERLPPQARLSKGRNNGDGTWSLKPEDLDGLAYLPANGTAQPPVLAIKVLSLDGDAAATLAQIDFPLPLGECPSEEAHDAHAPPGIAADAVAGEGAQARVAALEKKLAERSAQLEKALEDAAETAAAHARAIAALKDGQDKALREQATAAEARLSEELERRQADARAAAEKELEERVQSAVQEAVRQSEVQARARLQQARQGWQQALRRDLAQAEARARAEAVRDAGDDAELARLRNETETMRAALTAREGELSQVKATLQEAREGWREEARAALSEAQEAWKAAEAERLAAAEAQWRERSEQRLAEATARRERAEVALAEARAQAPAARDAGDDAELARLRDEVATLEAALASRESELARAESRLAESRERWQEQARAALSKAEKSWQAGEVERLAAAHVAWRKRDRIAKPRGAVARAVRGQRWARVRRRVLRGGAIAACLAAAMVFYPHIEPMMSERRWPTIVELKGEIAPWVNRAGDTVQSWLSDLTEGGDRAR